MTRYKLVPLLCTCLFFFSGFGVETGDEKQPKTITKTSSIVGGQRVEKTAVLLDRTTSREDLIHTCSFLAGENVQLTFDQLTIGRSFLGLFGKPRIRIAEGMIRLPNGSSQRFKAGGITSFKALKIQYSGNTTTEPSRIEMIEIVN